MTMLRLTVALLLLSGICVASDDDDFWGDLPLENLDLFEGDILLDEDSEDRNAITNQDKLWPKGIIPYVLDPELSSTVPLDMVKEAMREYGNKTCIRFVPRFAERNYIRIYPGEGCNAHVGKLKRAGEQTVSLGKGCGYLGTVLHELGHAIGFFHEHSRSDRDEWVTIFRENIKEGQETQFAKLRPQNNQLFTPFDYDSIMLYSSFTFSKDKSKLKTMVGRKGRILEGPRRKENISKSDILKIRKLYNCKKKKY